MDTDRYLNIWKRRKWGGGEDVIIPGGSQNYYYYTVDFVLCDESDGFR